MQNDDAFSGGAGQIFQALAELDFFRSEKFMAETTDAAKRRCLAEYK